MTDHAHELRRYARKIGHPAGDVPAVMLAAADEIERLQSVIAGQYTMSRDDIIKLALQCGVWIQIASGAEREQTIDRLQRLVGRAVAAEREACREVLEECIRTQPNLSYSAREALSEASARIYKRGDA